MVPNTAIAALARSIPAVRMMRVWPRASVPITVVWLITAEKLSILKNVFVAIEKNAIAIRSAAVGPSAGLRANTTPALFGLSESLSLVSVVAIPPSLQWVSAPAIRRTPSGVLGSDARDWLVGDQRRARVVESTGALAGMDGVDYCRDPVLGHLLRELHDGRHELARLHVRDS